MTTRNLQKMFYKINVVSQVDKPLTEYDTQNEAQDGAAYISKQYGGEPMIPYQCPTCSKWHLGRNRGMTT